MNYRFQVTAMDIEALLPQVSLALEKRVELASRKRLPGIWRVTDYFRQQPRASGKALRKRRKHTRVLGVLCLALGIIAFIPGLMEPRDWLLLLAGAGGIGAGAVSLLGGRRGKNPYDCQARQLLEGKGRMAEGMAPQVVFSPEGMTLTDGNGQIRTVSYDAFKQVLECEDIFLVAYGQWASILQKKDMAEGKAGELRDFLAQRVPYCRCEPQDSLYGGQQYSQTT